MAIPGDQDIQYYLMHLLVGQADGKMHCNDVYSALAEQFPQLTRDERKDPYANSVSLWANRVQRAVQHLRENGMVLHHTMAGGKGIWAVSEVGRQWLSSLPDGDELLKELMG